MDALRLARDLHLGPFSNVHTGFQNIIMRTFMFGVVGSLAMFIASWEKTDRMRDQLFDTHRDYGDTFDFVIVGGGTAGALVAKRLSEHYRVLLLEAGGDPHPFQSIPIFSSYMLNYKEVDWMHTTTPQKRACLSCDNRQLGISQGKSLGGTTNLNFMHHSRGSPLDYDNWADLIGDPSWSYENLLPYFKRHEEYAAHGPWSRDDHGFVGEMRLETPSYTGMSREFIASAKEMGYKRVDLNGKFTEGFDTATYAMKRGHRQGTFSSFIKSTRPRWNLIISKYSHVNRILMKERNGTQSAYGVEYDRHGQRRFAFAKKEIIVSAGAIQSAKLLLLSGIGPKEDLEALSIPVKADLPVGKNLQDHLHTFLGPFLLKSPKSLLVDRDITSDAFIKYSSIKSRGPLTTSGIQASGMITSSRAKRNSKENDIWPDIHLQLYGMAVHESYDKDMTHAFRLTKEMTSKYMKSAKGKDSFSIIVSVGRPESRGVVLLRNNDPYAEPIVDPKYFDKDSDMDVMVDGIQKALTLVENSTTFGHFGARFTTEMLPGCEPYLWRSDAYWECFASHFSVSMGHVAGTVAMGGALDSQLRVLGVNRLRVVDSSAMPTIVGTGTQAATLVIGEKGSDLIIKYWGITDNKLTGRFNHEDFTENPGKEFHNTLFNESQVLIRSTHGFQEPVKMDPNYIYNNIPTSEKPSTIKNGRSAAADPTDGNFTQSNSVSTADQSSTPLYDYSLYFPTERRPVVHIKDRNIPTQAPSTTSRPVKIAKHDIKALRAMENYFSEVTSTTSDSEETATTTTTEKATVYPNLNPTSLFDHLTSTGKYSTSESPKEIEEQRYINLPIEVVSYSKNQNNFVVQKGTPLVVRNPITTSYIETTPQPPVRFSKIPTRKAVSNYKYATNQIFRETMPLLSQRNKENPILQYQYEVQEAVPMRYAISPAGYGTNVHTLRSNVAKFLSPDQTQKVASQNSFIFSNKPVNFNAENIKQNPEGLRHSVFRILNPNVTYEKTTTPKPNALKTIFAPFSKLLETPLRFVKDPVKFVSDPLKFVAGHIKLVTDPLSKAVPEPFSKVIQAPINFMERIHMILNANKKGANNNKLSSPYGGFGTVLTTAVEASTSSPQGGFGFKVASAALPNNLKDHLTTTQPENSDNRYEISASTPASLKVPINNPSSTISSSFRKFPPVKYFSPPESSTASFPPFVNKGYGEHYTSHNNTFDYNQFTVDETSSESISDSLPKDYELVESDSIPIGKHPAQTHSQLLYTSEIQTRPQQLNSNLKVIYQPPQSTKQEVPYQIGDSVEKPNFYDFQKNFMSLQDKNKNRYETQKPVTEKPYEHYPNILETQTEGLQRPEAPKFQVFSKPETPKFQGFSRPETPKFQVFSKPETPKSQIFSKPETPKFEVISQPEPPKFQVLSKPESQDFPTHQVREQLISNIEENQEEQSTSKFPGSQILKVNTNDNNDHLPDEVKKLLEAQKLEKDTQIYVLLSDQQNLGENFENIPNLKEILSQFPEGTEIKSLVKPNDEANVENQVVSTSVQKTITSTSTTEKSEQSNLENPKNSNSYQTPTIVSGTKKSPVETQQKFYDTPWVLDPTASSTDNPALSFKIQILKPKK